MYNKPRQSPAVEIPLLKKLKRRRTNSPETGSPHGAHVAKIPKCAPGVTAVVKTELPNGATGIGAPALHVDTQGGSVAAENVSVKQVSAGVLSIPQAVSSNTLTPCTPFMSSLLRALPHQA